VQVHPVVLFSVIDHHLRRSDDQDRVIGASFAAANSLRPLSKLCQRTTFPVLSRRTRF